MVEVTLIAPTNTVQNVGAGNQQAQNATQTAVPTALRLSPGAIVAGVIVGKDSGGSYMLRTEQGTFSLHSATPLTYNSDVLIRVDTSAGSQAAARIISVNGEAFSAFSAPVQEETDSVSPSLLARAQQAAVPTESGKAGPVTIQATVVAPQPAPAPNAPATQNTQQTPAQVPVALPNPAPVAAGTVVLLQQASPQPQQAIVTVQQNAAAAPAPNAPGNAIQQTSAQTTQTQTQHIAQPATQAQPTPSAAPTTQAALPGNVAKLLVQQPAALVNAPQTATSLFNLSPENAAPTAPVSVPGALYAAYSKPIAAPLPAAQEQPATTQVEGQLVTANDDGTFTLQTPLGSLSLRPSVADAGLATGSAWTVTLPTAALPQVIANSFTSPQDSLMAALKNLFTIVQSQTPETASNLTSRLPQMGENFLATSLSFIANLRRGGARGALGESVISSLSQDEKTQSALAPVLAQMGHAASAISTLQESPGPTQGWLHFILPYLVQGEVQEARIFVKRDAPRKEREGRKNNGDTRFVVEVTFSDIGELQLDGMVIERDKSPLFDLIVRTHQPFPVEEQRNIIGIYNATAQMTGYEGSLSFQSGREFPVNPIAEMVPSQGKDITA